MRHPAPIIGLALVLSAAAGADEASPRAPELRQAVGSEGDTGLFHLPSARVLRRGAFAAALFRDNLDRGPRDLDVSTFGLGLAYGAEDRLELFALAELQVRIDMDAPERAGFANDYPHVFFPWQEGRGDLWLGAKRLFLDERGGDPVSAAARARLKLPTAGERLGTGRPSLDLDFALSGGTGRWSTHGAVGLRLHADPEAPRLGDALQAGLGLERHGRRLTLQGEVLAALDTGAESAQRTPVDASAGLVVWLPGPWFARLAVSRNFNFEGGASFRSSSGLRFALGRHGGSGLQPNLPPTVSCHPEREELAAGEVIGLAALAADPDGGELAFLWTATAGRVRGHSVAASFDSTGLAAPAEVVIQVEVRDRLGASARSACVVRVR